VIDVCFMAVFNLTNHACPTALCLEYAWFVLAQLKSVASKPINCKQDAYLFGMLTFLHCCLMRFQHEHADPCPPELLAASYATVMQLFQIMQDVNAEGFYILATVACLMKKDFVKLMD
jgi:hypothetical protein